MTVFWDVAPCSLVEVYRRFRGACYLHHQRRNIPKTVIFLFATLKTWNLTLSNTIFMFKQKNYYNLHSISKKLWVMETSGFHFRILKAEIYGKHSDWSGKQKIQICWTLMCNELWVRFCLGRQDNMKSSVRIDVRGRDYNRGHFEYGAVVLSGFAPWRSISQRRAELNWLWRQVINMYTNYIWKQ
jgi:hypothetical protein